MGCITELATSAPGQTSVRPNTKAPLAETLKLKATRRRDTAAKTDQRKAIVASAQVMPVPSRLRAGLRSHQVHTRRALSSWPAILSVSFHTGTDQMSRLTGKVAIQAIVVTKTRQPVRVRTQRRRRLPILVLMPAKNRTMA